MSKGKGQTEKGESSSFGGKIRNLGGKVREGVGRIGEAAEEIGVGLGPKRERVPVRIPTGGGRTGLPRGY